MKLEKLSKDIVRYKSLRWWNQLTKSKQREYEIQMFGYGELMEDNSLCDQDIIKLYKKYK